MRNNYLKLNQKAQELECILPRLVKKNDWEEIAQCLKIPDEIWDGKAADDYAAKCISVCKSHDKYELMRFPEIIWNHLATMQECDDNFS